MNKNLEASLNFLVLDEGGWVQRKSGALGNRGIGMQTLMDYRHAIGMPVPRVNDLRNLSVAEAKAIYTKLYAEPIGFSELPSGLDYLTLDHAVNSGVGAANRLLAATASISDVAERMKAMTEERMKEKQARTEWPLYGPGWTARIQVNVPKRALAMMDQKS
jgi:lysozyme family protein